MDASIKRTLINIFFVLLFIGFGIGIGVSICSYANRDTSKPGINVHYDDEESSIPDRFTINPKPEEAKEYLEKEYDHPYTYEFIKGYFVAYKYNDENGRYEYLNSTPCEDDCEIASYVHFNYEDLDVGRVVLASNEKSIIFDFNRGSFGSFDFIEIIQDNDEKYFVVKEGSTTSLMTLYGRKLYSIRGDLTDISLAGNQGLDGYMYSIRYNLMVYKENNKYGLLKLDSGIKVIEANFDYLRLIYYGKNEFNTSYVKIKENDKWYLYSIEENKKVLDIGYDQILTVYNDVLVVEDNKRIYFKDLKGNDLVKISIEISKSFEDIDWDWENIQDNVSFKVADENIYILLPNGNEKLYYSFEDEGIEDNGNYYKNIDVYLKNGQKNITVYKYYIKSRELIKMN